MGWTSYYATHYKKNGKVDVKAECDSLFDDSSYEVAKSCLKGSVYYAALKERKSKEVFAVVALTSTKEYCGCNFGYKDMDETMGPFYYDCPDSILDLLTETDCASAIEWRKTCRESNKSKKALKNLPIGSVIRFKMRDMEFEIEKHSPNHQFKTNWWKVIGENKYFPKTSIPIDFEVVSVGV